MSDTELITMLVAAVEGLLQHVYAQNDYTTRDYENYYRAVDEAKAALASVRDREQFIRSVKEKPCVA